MYVGGLAPVCIWHYVSFYSNGWVDLYIYKTHMCTLYKMSAQYFIHSDQVIMVTTTAPATATAYVLVFTVYKYYMDSPSQTYKYE